MNPIRNQKGLALVATLLMCILAFGVVAILFRLATQETKLAHLEQGYTAALDAAKAGTDLFIYMIENNLMPNPPQPLSPYSGPPNPFGTSNLNGQCLQVKMTNSTSSWSTNAAWGGCPSQANATSTNPAVGPDVTLTMPNCTVYVKLIDNYLTQATGAAPCQNGCYYYTVVARAQASGSSEHADIYFVYRYSR